MRAIILNWIFFILLICSSVSCFRRRFHTECPSNKFSCDTSERCILKNLWCNRQSDCGSGIDESFCSYAYFSSCGPDYFKCGQMCIPISGRCDGFTSCDNGSDEEDCPCDEMSESNGTINYEAYLGYHRTYHKCWKIIPQPNKQIILHILDVKLYERECRTGNLTVIVDEGSSYERTYLYCSRDFVPALHTAQNSVKILYRSSISFLHEDDNLIDSFKIRYSIEEFLCRRPDAFECVRGSCVLSEKVCDGVQDCINGLDEEDCKKGIAAIKGIVASRQLGLKWLMHQRNAAWGWRDNTHRAITALYLANGANFNGTNKDEDLTAKQLELQMSTAILRNGTDKITSTQLAMFINSLLIICHDPRNFYGFDLVKDLKKAVENSTFVANPLSYLALCNAKEIFSKLRIDMLFEILRNRPNHGILLDIQAATLLALSCITNNSEWAFTKPNITEATKWLKEQQLADGSFGSTYTSALIVQALLANGHEKDDDWNLNAAITFLKEKQNLVDGSFGDFLATYLILPLLNSKTLVDVGKVNCSENMRMPRDGNSVADIEYKLGPKITIQYSLCIGNEKDQIHPIMLRIVENVTVMDVMRLAAEIDPKYKFQSHNIIGKKYVYEISGIPNDPENGMFWLLYTSVGNSSAVLERKSPDEVIVNPKKNIIMWYKTAKIEDFREIPI